MSTESAGIAAEYEVNHDDHNVLLDFAHADEEGVESFGTGMPFDVARQFAADIIACCDCAERHGCDS
jgi:hypothetical protein